jgi:hypothetical protein
MERERNPGILARGNRCLHISLAPGAACGLDERLCYIVTSTPTSILRERIMPTHVPHPHHHPGRGHPPASISPSILRMSVLQRLAIAAALIVVLWGAVFWAMKV